MLFFMLIFFKKKFCFVASFCDNSANIPTKTDQSEPNRNPQIRSMYRKKSGRNPGAFKVKILEPIYLPSFLN